MIKTVIDILQNKIFGTNDFYNAYTKYDKRHRDRHLGKKCKAACRDTRYVASGNGVLELMN